MGQKKERKKEGKGREKEKEKERKRPSRAQASAYTQINNQYARLHGRKIKISNNKSTNSILV